MENSMRGGPMWTSSSSDGLSASSWTWVEAISNMNTDSAKSGYRGPCGEGLVGISGWKAQLQSAVCACSTESKTHPGLHQNQHGQEGEGSDFPSLLRSHLHSALGSPSTARTWTGCNRSRGDHRDNQKRMPPGKKDWVEVALLILEKRQLWDTWLWHFITWMGYEKMEGDTFKGSSDKAGV